MPLCRSSTSGTANAWRSNGCPRYACGSFSSTASRAIGERRHCKSAQRVSVVAHSLAGCVSMKPALASALMGCNSLRHNPQSKRGGARWMRSTAEKQQNVSKSDKKIIIWKHKVFKCQRVPPPRHGLRPMRQRAAAGAAPHEARGATPARGSSAELGPCPLLCKA